MGPKGARGKGRMAQYIYLGFEVMGLIVDGARGISRGGEAEDADGNKRKEFTNVLKSNF